MFNSGISVKDLIDELKDEVDIALEITNATYRTWLNSLQQLLYTEVIKEQKKTVLEPPFEDNKIDMSLISGNDENKPRFEDIHTVYADDIQLIKSTVSSGVIFPNTFYKDAEDLVFNATVNNNLTVVYFDKPALIKDGTENVMLPIEFIELAKSKLRGEAYKLANEDSIAAKWLNDYNVHLETFKAWIADKAPTFGM